VPPKLKPRPDQQVDARGPVVVVGTVGGAYDPFSLGSCPSQCGSGRPSKPPSASTDTEPPASSARKRDGGP
jgi:hypothetical protein